MPELMERCPYFQGCSRNFCPLDTDLAIRSGKARDLCRFMREPKKKCINGQRFISGGAVMTDASLNLMPQSNIGRLNTASKARLAELQSTKL
jgi:hypothetical protein